MSPPAAFPASFLTPWKELLASRHHEQIDDLPNYHLDDVNALVTTSLPTSIHVGTGYSIYERAILPAILAAERSVILVTCYWAQSATLDALNRVLVQLASDRQTPGGNAVPLRVMIGFSSRGLFQKLLHTSSRQGYVYPSSTWPSLGLPNEETLRSSNIELTVKSLFFTPLSVMHPKYVIVDGQVAFMPSCNVSWEPWFEGCIEVEGDLVQRLLVFHQHVWGIAYDTTAFNDTHRRLTTGKLTDTTLQPTDRPLSPAQSMHLDYPSPVPTILLPSSHHRNPRFNFLSFFPFMTRSAPPSTPLNAALLVLFANAKHKVSIVTPNLTSAPVVDALLSVLDRGVDVHVRTSKGMMLLEQLITAGTTTSRCLGGLIKRYKSMRVRPAAADLEAQPAVPGRLEVFSFKPAGKRSAATDEPTASHLKMVLVDDEYLVLGSGNMDRASWFTSQELGVLFHVPKFGSRALWDRILDTRLELYFDSDQQ